MGGSEKSGFEAVLAKAPLVLTEGAVGQRLEREYALGPDPAIGYAPLIYRGDSRKALAAIYREYLSVAEEEKLPILLLTNTRRVNRARLAGSCYAGKNVIGDYAAFLREVAAGYRCGAFIGGMTGCAGDAYTGEGALAREAAEEFHAWQMEYFARAGVDLIFAAIMPALGEIVGMGKAIEKAGLPYIVSLMIRRNGCLPDGHTIDGAIAAADAALARGPICYMTNCVHPAIAEAALLTAENRTRRVADRFCGIQANAACFEPEELDGSGELLSSAPEELAAAFLSLDRARRVRIAGGCCGTDARHLRAIARALKGEMSGSVDAL